jgi:hypothetical protein
VLSSTTRMLSLSMTLPRVAATSILFPGSRFIPLKQRGLLPPLEQAQLFLYMQNMEMKVRRDERCRFVDVRPVPYWYAFFQICFTKNGHALGRGISTMVHFTQASRRG